MCYRNRKMGKPKERKFIKTTPDKNIADDEFMAAAIGDVEWLRQSVRGCRSQVHFDANVSQI